MPALFASLVLLMAAAKKENALEDVALVSSLYSIDIYGLMACTACLVCHINTVSGCS
jgi:hypothetical protein